MYPMSKKSLAIRIVLLTVVLPLCLIGLVILILNLTFEYLWDVVDSLRDRFMNWVNRIAPLDSDKNKKV